MDVTKEDIRNFVNKNGKDFNVTMEDIDFVGIDTVQHEISLQFDPRKSGMVGPYTFLVEETDKEQAMCDYFAEAFGGAYDAAYIAQPATDSDQKYFSKEHPEDLMPQEILERVPELYGQEEIALADKEVFAAYVILFRSDWTWYLTEYDPKTHNAFGLVVGDYPEWGYFNLDELKQLGAQRLILEDFPKTFRELKDTELVDQLSKDELERVFSGTLTYSESPSKQDHKASHFHTH